jgi:4-hydroxy-L-threonine phosphate dehydrogenase PdxA
MPKVTARARTISRNRRKSKWRLELPRSVLSSPHWILVTRAPSSPDKPRIGITIGDPAGIGPEIVLKAVAEPEVCAACSPVLIGAATEIRRQARSLSLHADFRTFSQHQPDLGNHDAPIILDTDNLNESVRWGELSAGSGLAALAAIETCVRLCLAGRLDAMTTAPINKESIKLAGSPFPGHTEMITALCGVDESLMAFFAGNLRVFLLTIHTSLSNAIKSITRAGRKSNCARRSGVAEVRR